MFRIVLLLLFISAGVLGMLSSGRIVNGTDAQKGEIPYIVSIRHFDAHICGGSILSKKIILTAAHCVDGINSWDISVQYEVIRASGESNGRNILNVTEIIPHIYFEPENGGKNDIAILKVHPPIIFSSNAQPIRLPRAFNATPENAVALLSGWGVPHTTGFTMTELQKVYVIVYPDEKCEKLHAETGPTNRKYHICAGIPEGGKGQCTGDSGGPLVVDGVQVGIVSWSIKPCGMKGYPGVFTKVSTQIPWILVNIK